MKNKASNIYTVVDEYVDYGCFGKDGLPGVDTVYEEEFESLKEALKEFYMCVSFNEDVRIYKGNRNITKDYILNEAAFKEYYDDAEARKWGHFNFLTYEQSWECVKEYAEKGYSESMENYIDEGIVH